MTIINMARSSSEIVAQRREAVVQAASRLFRERGCESVGVPELMAEAGLTHGGFYRYFESKQALEAEAAGRALEETAEQVWALIEAKAGDGDAARAALVTDYLSVAHRDDPGSGCAIAALAADAARDDGPLRATLASGVERRIEILTGLTGGDRTRAMADLSALVGGLILARVTAGRRVSEDILAAVSRGLP